MGIFFLFVLPKCIVISSNNNDNFFGSVAFFSLVEFDFLFSF